MIDRDNATLKWLTPDDVRVIPRLQRKLSVSRVKRIALAWDRGLVGVLEGATYIDKGETYVHLIDGQTRMKAAELVGQDMGGIVELPVIVYEHLNEKQIAQLFLARNQLSSKVSAYDQFMVGVEAEDIVSLSILRAFEPTPFTISSSASAYEVASVGAVQASMKRAAKMLGSNNMENWDASVDHMTRVLDIIDAAWALSEGERVSGDNLRAVSWMVVKHNDLFVWDKTAPALLHLIDRLGAKDPKTWGVEALRLNETAPSTGQRFKRICELWIKAYNRGAKAAGVDKLGEFGE